MLENISFSKRNIIVSNKVKHTIWGCPKVLIYSIIGGFFGAVIFIGLGLVPGAIIGFLIGCWLHESDCNK